MKIKRKISVVFLGLMIVIGGFFYVYNRIYFSVGNQSSKVVFDVVKGEGSAEIASNLENKGLIESKIYFWLYLKTNDLLDKIYPGEYVLGGNLTIPQIAAILTNPQKTFVTVTFPEGWTMRQMADRLSANGFDGEEFFQMTKKPSPELESSLGVLADKPDGATLEGYLFPDTYRFSREATPEGILKKILDNTETKITTDIRAEIENQKKSIFQILTMASIIEREAKFSEEMGLVSSVFWNRLAIGQRLQSDATLEYVLGTNDVKHSLEQLKNPSPYNTYQVQGLPPGPVSNPGMNAIDAAINPTRSDYFYFLTDLDTKKTIFSKTFEEHVANKAKYGL